MWILWFVLGLGGMWYVIKYGILNPKMSMLERVTYGWLSLPLIAMYLLFGFIIVIVPVIAIMVLLEDIPILGIFVLVGVILVVANVIKNWNKDDNNDNAPKTFAEAVERVTTTNNSVKECNTSQKDVKSEKKEYETISDIFDDLLPKFK